MPIIDITIQRNETGIEILRISDSSSSWEIGKFSTSPVLILNNHFFTISMFYPPPLPARSSALARANHEVGSVLGFVLNYLLFVKNNYRLG